jgi:amino acid transporter
MQTQPMSVAQSGLKPSSISFWGALAISFGNMAPAAGVMFVPQAMAPFTGTSLPLAFLLSMLAAFCTASSLIFFSRRFSSAGSAYAFSSLAFNKFMGFMSGWLLFLAYGLSFPGNTLVFGFFTSALLSQVFGVHISWALFSLVVMVLVVLMVVRGVAISAKVDLVLIIIESVIVLSLALVVIMHGGAHGNTWIVFTPRFASGDWVGILFGMLYGVGAFAGFEASITVAEETKNRYRAVPMAIMTAVALGGVIYVAVSYAIAIGFGAHDSVGLRHASLPLSVLGARYIGGWMAIVIDGAGMVSSFGVSLAASNAGSRVLYAMGRDGVVFSWLGRLHRRYATPSAAMLLLAAFTAALVFGLGLPVGPYPTAFSYIGVPTGLFALTLYVLANVGWIRMWWRHPGHFGMVWGVAVIPPILGAVIMFVPLVTSVVPIPKWPYNLFTYVAFAYAASGILLGWRLKRRDAVRFAQLGQVFSAADS